MEEKKLEQTNEEVDSKVEHEAEPQEETESLLEPTPYQNKYKRDLDKEDSEDTATTSKDTSSEEEATPDEERPVNAEDKVLRKDMTTLNATTILLSISINKKLSS